MRKIRKKLKKGECVQMPLSEFIRRYPEIVKALSIDLEQLAKDDERYIVRFGINFDGLPTLELGFPSDNWFMS